MWYTENVYFFTLHKGIIMMLNNSNKPSLKQIRRLKTSMIVGYAMIVVTAIALVSFLALRTTDHLLKTKVSSLTSSLNVQMKLNMDSYLARMETIGTLAFAAEETYTYDATDPNNDEYEAINTEKIISDKLYSLCIMENFVDYGIVYRNNRTVGKISNGTIKLFGEGIYSELESMITRQRTRDGWAAGYQENFKRIYYVKRIHDNALLIISFYTAELENVFDNPETMSDMDIRLTNQNYDILYSSVRGEVGTPLPDDIKGRIQDRNSATVMDSEYLVTLNSCGDDWYVICSIPTPIILKELHTLRLFIILAAIFAAIFAAFTGTLFSLKLTKPVESYVASLDTKAHMDQLTGLLNKNSFEEYTNSRLANSLSIEQHALILLDVDNFKGVNDTLGHAYGDKVLAKIGSILRAEFSTEDFLGRIGGDEFAVFMNASPEKGQCYKDFVSAKCDSLCEAFHSNYTGDDSKYKISASIGVAVFHEKSDTFQTLYKIADEALYSSKERGKDTYTIGKREVK